MARILFISAPFGSFFRALASQLSARGNTVWRLTWDGGDFIETPAKHRIVMPRREAGYERYLEDLIKKKRVTAIVTYNDTGDRNRIALRLAKRLGLARYILEHGYIRPHWITFDRDGVNGHAKLPKDLGFYESHYIQHEPMETFPCRMRDQVISTMRHFTASLALYPLMPFDTKYYGDSVFIQAAGYAAEYIWRKTHSEWSKIAEISAHRQQGKKVFAVILQKPGDAQLRVHSSYGSNQPFLHEVCTSFAEFAPSDAILVIKQHPLDYGIERLPSLFDSLVTDLSLKGRAYFLRKTSLDVVLDHASGFVTVNSTAGLTAVHRGMAVKCCGSAIFDMEGLTFQGSIDDFWAGATPPAPKAVEAFISYLKNYSQVNGAIYAPSGIALASEGLSDIFSQELFAPHSSPERVEKWGETEAILIPIAIALPHAA